MIAMSATRRSGKLSKTPMRTTTVSGQRQLPLTNHQVCTLMSPSGGDDGSIRYIHLITTKPPLPRNMNSILVVGLPEMMMILTPAAPARVRHNQSSRNQTPRSVAHAATREKEGRREDSSRQGGSVSPSVVIMGALGLELVSGKQGLVGYVLWGTGCLLLWFSR